VGEVVVESVEGEVDGVFALVVHADTDEDLDAEGGFVASEDIGLAFVHLLELVDEAAGFVYFAEVGIFGGALVVVLVEVIGLDGSGVEAEGSALVVYLLLEDPWRGVYIQHGVANVFVHWLQLNHSYTYLI
jgi:hypothetical protein